MLKKLQSLNPCDSLIHILYYCVCWHFFRAIMVLVYGYRSFGSENVPAHGGYLVVANHQSFFDPPLMGVAIKRHTYSIARSTLFRNPIFAKAISLLNAIPVRRGQTDTSVFKICIEHLKRGRLVMVYPEGVRTTDGQVAEFQRGIMLLIRRAKVPVIPIAVEGAYDNWPRHSKRPFVRGPIEVRFGKPIPAEELLAMSATDALEHLRQEVDTLRLELRSHIRHRTGGAYPPSGSADG